MTRNKKKFILQLSIERTLHDCLLSDVNHNGLRLFLLLFLGGYMSMIASTPFNTASDSPPSKSVAISPRKSQKIAVSKKGKKKLGKTSPKSKNLAPKKRMATKPFPFAKGPKNMSMKKNPAPKGYNFAAAEKKLGVVS